MTFAKGEVSIYTCEVGHKYRWESAAKNCHWCKRKGVPRNKPGKSMLFQRIRHLHIEEIVPVMNNVRRDWEDHQYKLFKGDVNVTKRSGVKMGNFYETMTACLFGGHMVRSPAEIGARANGNLREVVPDIICDERRHIIESKACQQRGHLNLYDTQVLGYEIASKIKGYRARWAIWRHGFEGIHSYRGSLADLYDNMADKTYAGLILPLKLISTLWGQNDKFKRYDRPGISGLTALPSKFMNNLILDPTKSLTDIGIDHNEYRFERMLSPKELMVENALVPQFPLMIIRNVEPDSWVDGRIPF